MAAHGRTRGAVLALGATALLAGTALVGATPGTASAAGGLVVSEVAPWGSGNSAYAADWFELTNNSPAPIDLTGWRIDDSSNSAAAAVPMAGVTTLAPGASAIFLESATPATTVPAFLTAWFGATPSAGLPVGTYTGAGVGLSTGGDAVNVFDAGGALRASVSFGASPATAPFPSFDNAAGLDASVIATASVAGTNGAFLAAAQAGVVGSADAIGSPGTATVSAGGGGGGTTTPTTPPAPTGLVWPGSATVRDASTYLFGGNLSGLIEEGSGTAAPGALWAVRNGPGTLFRLVWNGTTWAPDAGDWAAGKTLRFPDGTGDPDAEGVTFTDAGSAGGIYVATERNNAVSNVSRPTILRVDPTAAGTSLTATQAWDLTADLPVVGANLGPEAITWIPDSFLVGQGFRDEKLAKTYDPTDHPGHGNGLFFVGVEANGTIYAYALKADGTSTRIATIASGWSTIMELQFDRERQDLWAVCDNTCKGQHKVLRIDPATGAFGVALTFERPAGLPDYNNEGFAFAPLAGCVNDRRPAYWADDTENLGVSIRQGDIPCTAVLGGPGAVVPEFPLVALSTLSSLLVVGGVLVTRRRSAAGQAI